MIFSASLQAHVFNSLSSIMRNLLFFLSVVVRWTRVPPFFLSTNESIVWSRTPINEMRQSYYLHQRYKTDDTLGKAGVSPFFVLMHQFWQKAKSPFQITSAVFPRSFVLHQDCSLQIHSFPFCFQTLEMLVLAPDTDFLIHECIIATVWKMLCSQ